VGCSAVDDQADRKHDCQVDLRHRVGANLKRLREGAGLSQEDLMKLSEVHRTQISKYERGESEPQVEALAKLSRALGVSAEDFLPGVDWQTDPPRLVIRPVDPDTAK